jgi:transketolase
MAQTDELARLRLHAARARRHVVRLIEAGHAGHMGGAMSAVDLVTALYFSILRHDPANPAWPERDRFVLSAGHKAMAQYAVLAEAGYFDPAELDTYGALGTHLPGHPDRHKLPGIEANTGALGHGLAICLGMALGLRGTGARVFTILGDGELPEGSNWEAFAAAAHHRADNLFAFVDVNGLQISGRTADVMNTSPAEDRLAAFGWTTRVIDGHDFGAILNAVAAAEPGRPTAIVAHTTKAKGLSFAEDKAAYHYWKPGPDELAQAIAELDAAVAAAEREVAA